MNIEEIKVLVDALIKLILAILTIVVIPYIRSKIDANKLAKIEEYTALAVRCAEQIYTQEEWKEKKEYVLDYITLKVREIGIEMTAEDVEMLIEGIVNEIKKG